MNPISCRPACFITFAVLTSMAGLCAAETNQGNVQLTTRVWEFDSQMPLQEIAPIASRLLKLPPGDLVAYNGVPDPKPLLPGTVTLLVSHLKTEALDVLHVLEAEFGAKSHPEVSRTVPIGHEAAFMIPFASQQLEMRVLPFLECRLREGVSLLISFPNASRSVNPIQQVRSSAYSLEGTACLLCRTETRKTTLHHTLILLEETHYGVSGKDSVTRTRNKLHRFVLPAAHLEPMTSLQFLEWLVNQSRKLDRQSNGASGQGINVIFLPGTPDSAGSSDSSKQARFIFEDRNTMRDIFFRQDYLGAELAVEPHALVFRAESSENECSPSVLWSRRFRVKPRFLDLFQDNAAINAAATQSNVPAIRPEPSGFTLDRSTLLLTYRQLPKNFMLAEKWLRDQKLLDETPLPAPKTPAALVRAGKIILPQLDLRRASLAEAVKALEQAAASADPPVKNLNIIIEPSDLEETVITMFTRGMPAAEALRYCADLSYRRVVADDSIIILRAVTNTKLEP